MLQVAILRGLRELEEAIFDDVRRRAQQLDVSLVTTIVR